MTEDLFKFQGNEVLKLNAPLAERMRPRTLDEFIGQDSILAEGRLLRRAIATDRIGNLLLHGPPGIGKTTLARIIASHTRSNFRILNAVLAGVKDIRKEVEEAKNRLELYGLRSILFIDEVHRFNSAQQDALLPWVENGTITLIGATTENPFFEVNKALLSRSRLFRLQPLQSKDLYKLLRRALDDKERGYGNKKIVISSEASNHLVDISNGDARSLLNALELAVESTNPDKTGQININLLIAEESIQERAVLYDKNGDAHFDTISAFIKSLRGSDPDASLFWLSRMLEAGESPRFIFRRMLICASEDIGLADPQAIVIVQSCAEAFERVGLPEGIYSLSQAALYLAITDKSNSLSGFFSAQKCVKEAQKQDVPSHLRDSHRDGKVFQDGVGYLYPHSYPDHWVAQKYLPNQLQGEIFWSPTSQGWEGKQLDKILERRAAQFATIAESELANPFPLTSGPEDFILNQWVQRQLTQEGERLHKLESKLWFDASWSRNHRALVITGDSLLWALSPLKFLPEGGVTIVSPIENHSRLSLQLELLDEIRRPNLIDRKHEVIDNLPENMKFEWIGARIYSENLDNHQTSKFWESITKKSTSETCLRILSTHSENGPANSLKKMLLNKDNNLENISFLDEIIELEKNWLESHLNEKILIKRLNNFGWEISIKKWEENLFLTIDKSLEHRWLSEGTRYRSLLDQNISEESINKIRVLLHQMIGKMIPYQLSHHLISGIRINK